MPHHVDSNTGNCVSDNVAQLCVKVPSAGHTFAPRCGNGHLELRCVILLWRSYGVGQGVRMEARTTEKKTKLWSCVHVEVVYPRKKNIDLMLTGRKCWPLVYDLRQSAPKVGKTMEKVSRQQCLDYQESLSAYSPPVPSVSVLSLSLSKMPVSCLLPI